MANYWLAVGSPENWKTAFEYKNTWGLKQTQRHLWAELSENDLLFFYATQPVIGVIGYGIVKTKFTQDKPLWPQEIREGRVIWPLRLELDIEKCLPDTEWTASRISSEDLKRRTRSGFQRLNEDMGKWLISQIQSLHLVEYVQKPSEDIGVKVAEDGALYVPSHDDVKLKLVEIGKIQGFLADAEYPIQIGSQTSRLDAVWRKLAYSVPTYVFEVQVGGDVQHALGKLKHAFDLWNSHIYIVAPESDHGKVDNLLSGTFHEIDNRLNFIELGRVEELYTRKRSYFELEKELGIKQ
jgi:hypothetical protein